MKKTAAAAVQTSALPPADTEEYRSEPIAIGLLDESPTNQRRTYNSVGLAELAESLKSVGMIQAMVVRRQGQRFEIVVGSRRFRAAQIAGLATVPATVRNLTDAEVRIIQLIENLQRANVNPLEEALGYRELMKSTGFDVPTVAAKIAKSVSYVYQRLKLADLIEPAQKAFRRKELTPGHAILIARLPEAWQKRALADCARGATVRQLAELIHRELHHDVKKGGFDPTDGALVKGVPACAACPKLSGNAAGLYGSEIKSKTVCTDADCYERKAQARIAQAVASGAAGGEKLLKIKVGHDYWHDQPKDVLLAHGYTLIAGQVKPCPQAQPAIIAFGLGRGKIVSVCASPKCKQHHAHGADRYGRDEKQIAKEREERRNLDIQRIVRGRLVDALLDSMPMPAFDHLTHITWLMERLEDWAEQWWPRLGSDIQRLVRKRHPEWDADTIPVGDLKVDALARLVNEFALSGCLQVWSYSTEQGVPEDLRARCETYQVPWLSIESEVRNEFMAKGKKKAKASPAAAVAPILTEHDWEKTNLVTVSDRSGLYDTMRCKCCGITGKRFGLGPDVRRDPKFKAERYLKCIAVKDGQAGVAKPAEIANGGGATAPWERVCRRLDAITEPFPEPNESGVFLPEVCTVVDSKLKGCEARVFLVRTAEGWRQSYEFSSGQGAAAGYPNVKDECYGSPYLALIAGLDRIIQRMGQPGGSKKAQGYGRKIVEWARALWRDAVDVEGKRRASEGARDAHDPEATEKTAVADVFSDPMCGMTSCPQCGVYVVAGALETHLQQCEGVWDLK